MKQKSALKSKPQIYTLDATDKILGRLATQVATILIGKNKVTFLPNEISKNLVVVKNISKIKLSGKKIEQKKYYSYSGYPGGLKTKKIKEIFKKNPAEIFKRAVFRMLPKNKLQPKIIKRLKLEN